MQIDQTKKLLTLLQAKKHLETYDKFSLAFPDTGPYARDLYPKQLRVFAATNKYREVCFMAGNRTGKTFSIAFAMTAWLTGKYPTWWEGKRFKGPIQAWACCVTNREIGEVLNEILLGPPGQLGTGLIPKEDIVNVTKMPGVPNTIESAEIKHISGGISYIGFKSYQQTREAYQGTAKHVIWFDEEPPRDIYSEGLTRTAVLKSPNGTREKGLVVLSFTPLKGLSDVVKSFMPGGKIPDVFNGSKIIVGASWEDVPHIDDETKAELIADYSPHEVEARTKGLPQLGSGAIYPIPESQIIVKPIKIPDYWPRWFGADHGIKCTAAVFFTKDPNTGTMYIYDEYKRGFAEPSIHIDALKAKGADWIPGLMDAAALAGPDGNQYIQVYADGGLNVQLPYKSHNTLNSGIQTVFKALSLGELKVFETCQHWLEEYRMYHRDEDGKVVKEHDHIMDSMRYGIQGINLGISRNEVDVYDEYKTNFNSTRNPVTGY